MTAQSDWEQIAGKLRGLSHEGGAIEAAQVSVVGLDEIRRAAGARWPRLRARVREGSLSILSRRLGEDDVLIPAGDGFLVVFAKGVPEEIARRCAEMQAALLSFYLGEDAFKALRPHVEAQSLTAESVAALLGAGAAPPPPAAPCIVMPVFSTHEQRTVIAFGAPLLSPGRSGYDSDFMAAGRHDADVDHLDLDLVLLDECLARLARARQGGALGAAGVTLNVATLQQRKARDLYMARLRGAEAELRRRLVVLVAEIPKGAPLATIADWCATLRPHIGQVWLDFHHSDQPPMGLGAAGAGAAGFQLPRRMQTGRAEHLRDQIALWSRTLHAQQMRLFVRGVPGADFLAQAAPLGVDFAAGDALWPFEPMRGGQAHGQAR